MKETKYAGTQTEKNLMTAFAGESEARNKYTYFASKAKKEGYEQIAARTKLTGYDRETGGFCCLLVTSRNRKDGILVDGEGYHYARYAAYVPNKQALDLRGVVRDNLDLKSKER